MHCAEKEVNNDKKLHRNKAPSILAKLAPVLTLNFVKDDIRTSYFTPDSLEIALEKPQQYPPSWHTKITS